MGSLPLESEESTLGAAQRDLASRGSPHIAASEIEDNSNSEFGDWEMVPEQPDRLLERMVNVPSYCGDGDCTGRTALQKLTAVSRYTAEHTARYATELLQMLPQECRELVDAPRAFAWVHLQDAEEHQGGRYASGLNADLLAKLPLTEGIRTAVLGDPMAECRATRVGSFVACVLLRGGGNGRAEVLVATARGCAHVFEWSPAVGGECRLRGERPFMGQQLDKTSRWAPLSLGEPGLARASVVH